MSNAPRTAFVLGAGLGTRLRPLTARRPKPLIPVGGKPLICHAMDHLLALGVERFVVNTHWCAERYAANSKTAIPQSTKGFFITPMALGNSGQRSRTSKTAAPKKWMR